METGTGRVFWARGRVILLSGSRFWLQVLLALGPCTVVTPRSSGSHCLLEGRLCMSPVRYGKGDKGEARWSSLPRGPQAPFPRTCLSTCHLPGLQAHGALLPQPMPLSLFFFLLFLCSVLFSQALPLLPDPGPLSLSDHPHWSFLLPPALFSPCVLQHLVQVIRP